MSLVGPRNNTISHSKSAAPILARKPPPGERDPDPRHGASCKRQTSTWLPRGRSRRSGRPRRRSVPSGPPSPYAQGQYHRSRSPNSSRLLSRVVGKCARVCKALGRQLQRSECTERWRRDIRASVSAQQRTLVISSRVKNVIVTLGVTSSVYLTDGSAAEDSLRQIIDRVNAQAR